MRSSQRRRRLSLTSLIDVIFLLLLFFMLSSTFSKFAEIPLPLGGAGGTSFEHAPLFVRISDDSVTLNGRSLNVSELAHEITLQPNLPRHLIIATTPTATSQKLVDVLSALRTIPDTKINILVPS